MQAIEVGDEMNAADRCWEIIKEGSCEIDKAYTGPRLSVDAETSKPKMTVEFIKQMADFFKEGKFLPRRIVWDIVLATYEIFAQEESLAEIIVDEGVTCDVIGDTHGKPF